MNRNYYGAAHPLSDAIKNEAQKRLKQLPNRGRFGDARDGFVASLKTNEPLSNPCTSRGLSTMPRKSA